jgi:hypothetical protein
MRGGGRGGVRDGGGGLGRLEGGGARDGGGVHGGGWARNGGGPRGGTVPGPPQNRELSGGSIITLGVSRLWHQRPRGLFP